MAPANTFTINRTIHESVAQYGFGGALSPLLRYDERLRMQARQGAASVPSMFSSSEVKVFYPT